MEWCSHIYDRIAGLWKKHVVLISVWMEGGCMLDSKRRKNKEKCDKEMLAL
jgi:hypothetical protein